jgi:hypothetical protein
LRRLRRHAGASRLAAWKHRGGASRQRPFHLRSAVLGLDGSASPGPNLARKPLAGDQTGEEASGANRLMGRDRGHRIYDPAKSARLAVRVVEAHPLSSA